MLRCWPLTFLAFVVAVAPVTARPPHKKAIADFLGPFLPNHLNDCRLCHLPDKPGEKPNEEEKPQNAFGLRLVAVRSEVRKAGKDIGIAARLQAIAAEDADGDGTPNLLEILAGRNPGEAADKANDSELKRGARMLTALNARKAYEWKPFQAVVRPGVPAVKNVAWVRNPVDAFIAEQHEAFGLKPRPEAPPDALLRRVYLDLTGLPPSPEELEAFRKDPSPEAYEQVVDGLLASPRHAERWARHWMDIWRYVDGGTSGLQDGWVGTPHMWRWRDWIIDSLQADKSYARMVQELLAGDELEPDNPDIVGATAFLARNNNRSRDNYLHDIVNHTSRAFLGLTLECARCHDHKYDDLSQVEYYEMRAIFETQSPRVEGDKKKKDALSRVVDEKPTAPTYLYIRGVEQNPDKSKSLPPGVPALLGDEGFKVEPVVFTKEGKKTTSTGRRLAFARWLTRPEQPLTARVAVNHVWLRHTGQAIVGSTFNFGADGQPPTHPALLDWLAAEFMSPTTISALEKRAEPWSLKHLHRVIVTFNAYQMASTPDVDSLAFDPDNRFLWRMAPRRMEAEVVRDALLAVAGNIDLTMHGPDLDTKRGLDMPRRSVYFKYSDSDFLRFLEFFDPPATEDCYYRPQSIIPQQALTLLNSDLALVQSRRLARKLASEAGDRFIEEAFEAVLSRSCTAAEEKVCREYVAEQTAFFVRNKDKVRGAASATDYTKGFVDPALRARENLVHLLFNHHDFVTIR